MFWHWHTESESQSLALFTRARDVRNNAMYTLRWWPTIVINEHCIVMIRNTLVPDWDLSGTFASRCSRSDRTRVVHFITAQEEEEDNQGLQSISRVNTDNCSNLCSAARRGGLCSNFPAAVRSEMRSRSSLLSLSASHKQFFCSWKHFQSS